MGGVAGRHLRDPTGTATSMSFRAGWAVAMTRGELLDLLATGRRPRSSSSSWTAWPSRALKSFAHASREMPRYPSSTTLDLSLCPRVSTAPSTSPAPLGSGRGLQGARPDSGIGLIFTFLATKLIFVRQETYFCSPRLLQGARPDFCSIFFS
jgi:hypothetical protein